MNSATQTPDTLPLAGQGTKSSKGRKLIRSVLGIAALVASMAYGQHWWVAGRFLEHTDDAYVGGELTALSAKVPGYVAALLVEDNQAVKAGDLLVKLDDREYQAAVHEAEGLVAAQKALLHNLKAMLELQHAVIAKAEAAVVSAQAETIRARDDAERYRSLSSTSAVSIQSWQRADTVHKQAIAAERAAVAELDAARKQIAVIETQMEQARAALLQAQAAHERALLDLSFTEIRAPRDGVIGNRRVREGAYAAAGALLLVVVPAEGLWVDANFKENQLADMRPGQPAEIEADILPGHIFKGRVASLAPATGSQFSVLPTENATGNFTKIVQRVPVRIQLDADDALSALLRPGLSVVATVDTRR